MDPGLVTSERGTPHSSTSTPHGSMMNKIEQSDIPTVKCRSCRVQIPLDSIDSHECRMSVSMTNNGSSSHSRDTAVNAAVARAESFLDSFLDKPSNNVTDSPKPPVRPQLVKAFSTLSSSLPSNIRPAEPLIIQPGVYHSDYQHTSQSESSSRQESTNHSPLGSKTSNWGVDSTYRAHPISQPGIDIHTYQPHPRLVRAVSLPSEPVYYTSPMPVPTSSVPAMQSLKSTTSVVQSKPIQCRVRGVRVNKNRVAVYSIISSIANTLNTRSPASNETTNMDSRHSTHEIIIERRYREFYAFALNVYAMFPSKELWQRLPPKTFCFTKDTLNDGFLLRRKNGLDDFVRCAIDMMDLGSAAEGNIGQWYLVRKFLNLPPMLTATPTKDRSLVAAMHELSKHARQTSNWTPCRKPEEHDAIYEKTCDGFQMIKRVRMCHFPARAVFDMIIKRTSENSHASIHQVGGSTDAEATTTGQSNVTPQRREDGLWDPYVESEEMIKRMDGHTWTERIIFRGPWTSRRLQMINLKSWKVDESGNILIVIIPADEADWQDSQICGSEQYHRVDCILGGWVITPTPHEDTCTVTWLMEANFGECDAQSEFTGGHGFTSYLARNCLLTRADEITYLLAALESSYNPVYYRNLGPLLSESNVQNLKLERADSMVLCTYEDPKVYIIARELEPCLCLLLHKSTSTNVLVFKTHHRSKMDLDTHLPLKAEWIMFEKPGNPRQDLSTIERNTTFSFSMRHIGPNVYHFKLDLIRRDCVLRYDPAHGYAIFTTINGKPNSILKRVYLNYSKVSRLGFSKIEDITLVSDNDLEVLPVGLSK